MGITDRKMLRDSGTASKSFQTSITSAINLAAATIRVIQVPFSFTMTGVKLYSRTVAGAYAVLVGIVRPGRAIQAVTMAIATIVDRFQLTSALTAVMPTRISSTAQPLLLPLVVNKAVQDDIEFSTAFTINVAAAAGQFWGAARIQMNAAGVVSTKVVSQDQVYLDQPGALAAVPDADPGYFNLGTIAIRSAAGVAFTANTTALNAAGTTVSYNGVAAGFTNVLTANPAFVAASFVRGAFVTTMAARSVAQIGGLIVLQATSDGAAALLDADVGITYRPWPLNGESAPNGT